MEETKYYVGLCNPSYLILKFQTAVSSKGGRGRIKEIVGTEIVELMIFIIY